MDSNLSFAGKRNEDLIAALMRKQIDELNLLLRDLESGKPLNDYAHENLRRHEMQIRWLRTEALVG